MKLIIFCNRDLESNLFLNLILPKISTYVIGIYLSDAVGKKSIKETPKALLSLKFLEQTLLNETVFPMLDASSRNLGTKLLTFSELSKKYGFPIESCNDVISSERIKWFQKICPDLVLSIRYGKIFKQEFIKIPKYGILNLHSGKLPDYRGVLATFRALQNGDDEIMTTLHFIEDGTIDTGRIIGFSPIQVNKSKSLLGNIMALYPASVPLVVDTIKKIAEGNKSKILTTPNDGGNYFSFPSEEDICSFSKLGWEFTIRDDFNTILKLYSDEIVLDYNLIIA